MPCCAEAPEPRRTSVPDPHFAYCATLKDKVSMVMLTEAAMESPFGQTGYSKEGRCVFCMADPMTDCWPPGMFILSGYVVCLHCAERHGT